MYRIHYKGLHIGNAKRTTYGNAWEVWSIYTGYEGSRFKNKGDAKEFLFKQHEASALFGE